MNNVLLDPLPEYWENDEGRVYALNTSFRIGIQICLAQDDPDMSQYEKNLTIRRLLFACDPPDNGDDFKKCVDFFLGGWNHDNLSGKNDHKRLMDFDIDQWRIYSAFRQQYGINLNEADLHWWEFMGMLSALTECTYTRVVDIRQRDFKPKMDKEERKALSEAKEIYTLANPMSADDREIEGNLFDFLGGTKTKQEQERIKKFESYADE